MVESCDRCLRHLYEAVLAPFSYNFPYTVLLLHTIICAIGCRYCHRNTQILSNCIIINLKKQFIFYFPKKVPSFLEYGRATFSYEHEV